MTVETTIRVGAADDADIVIKQSTVSKYHCELRWTEQGWMLRDLESTNGTYVDGRRLREPCFVTTSQRITLGRDVPLTLPERPKKEPILDSSNSTNSIQSHATEKPPAVLRSSWIVGCVLVGLISMISIGRILYNSAPSKNPIVNAETAPPASDLDIAKATPEVSSASASGTPSDLPSPISAQPSESAFWAIIVESADGKSQQLVGTAVAIEQHRLLTLASIVEAIEETKELYPTLTLQQFQRPGMRIKPSQVLVHPKYKQALGQLTKLEMELKEKLKTIESMSEPTLEESLDWSGRFESAMTAISTSDLACMVTQEKFMKTLSMREGVELKDSLACKIQGYPMIVPSPVLSGNLQKFYLDGVASLRMDDKSKSLIPFAETTEFLGMPMVSMVCLDAESRIIGLCVRQEDQESLGAPQRTQLSKLEAFWK